MCLRWHIVFDEVACLRFFQFPCLLFSKADLDGVDTVSFDCFDLGDLAAIELYDCAGHMHTPTVPKVCHSHFVAQNARALTLSTYGLRQL